MIKFGQTKFNQLLESIEGINPKTLSARLNDLEKYDIITRRVYSEKPVRIEYIITKKGMALSGLLDQMASFSMQFCPEDIFKDGNPRTFKQVYGKRPKTLS